MKHTKIKTHRTITPNRKDKQQKSYNNVKHNLKSNSAYIDKVRLSLFPFLNITNKKMSICADLSVPCSAMR